MKKKIRKIRTINAYRFYYTTKNEEKEVAIKKCKCPSATKIWKNLVVQMNKNEVESIGFDIIT